MTKEIAPVRNPLGVGRELYTTDEDGNKVFKSLERERKLIPHPVGGVDSLGYEGEYGERNEAVRESQDLDEYLKGVLEAKGVEPPTNVNLALTAVEEFQVYAHQAQDLRRVIKRATDPADISRAAILYEKKKRQVDEYLDIGPPFEKAYREYLKERGNFIEFKSGRKKLQKLQKEIASPAFASVPDSALIDEKAQGRLEAMSREAEIEDADEDEVMAALETLYDKDSQEYKDAVATIQKSLNARESERPKTKKELQQEAEKLDVRLHDLWENPMVRRFWQTEYYMDTLIGGFARGENVLGTQSVVNYRNKLKEWEDLHQRTTVGGVLVGPPGVGKTTLVENYLERTGRDYAYIDASQEMTWYLLWGSKEIEFTSRLDYLSKLKDAASGLTDGNIKEFVGSSMERIKKQYPFMSDSEAQKTALSMLFGELEEAGEELKVEGMGGVKERLEEITKEKYTEEVVKDVKKVMHAGRNGWRDGIILSALRNGESLIIDEFNHMKNWDLIYHLLTSQPGGEFYFKPTEEKISVPKNWRMYFTANIGKKHGGFAVAEALASRAGGKVLEVPYPPKSEEMMVALASISDPEGNILRSTEDLSKMYRLINEVFEPIRDLSPQKRESIAISYRTIRDIGEKLVQHKDPDTGKTIFRATDVSFDEAVYEVLVGTYGLYEDKGEESMPANIIKQCLNVGLLLDDKVKDRVLQYVDEAEYEEKKKAHEAHSEDYAELSNKIRGMSMDYMNLAFPTPESV